MPLKYKINEFRLEIARVSILFKKILTALCGVHIESLTRDYRRGVWKSSIVLTTVYFADRVKSTTRAEPRSP